MPGLRFRESAAQRLREAIREAGGVEVFAIGDVGFDRRVSRLEIHCRGTKSATPALLTRPRAGQVVIHNHPSGNLQPSSADFALANRYGDEGIGVIIVDSDVERDNWVVEPAKLPRNPVDPSALVQFFEETLPQSMTDFEGRDGQLPMAMAVADTLHDERILLAEAGTGTGKSLAYLIPSILWAKANDAKVVISTYTRNLQAQLVGSDIPLAIQAGLEFDWALLKGRGNYLCRRKLVQKQREEPKDALWKRLQDWADHSVEGSLQDLGEPIEDEEWERVASDTDHTLRTRCPHYNDCFFYNSRRKAAASHILVVNHALLLADLNMKRMTGGDGLLPRYERVILDEAHHLQEAATNSLSMTSSAKAIRRAIGPLLPTKKRKGAFAKLAAGRASKDPDASRILEQVTAHLKETAEDVPELYDLLGAELLQSQPEKRITPSMFEDPDFQANTEPLVQSLSKRLRTAISRLSALETRLEDIEYPVSEMQPVKDISRTRRRLEQHLERVNWLLQEGGEEWCRWAETTGALGSSAKLCVAPIDVNKLLKDILWHPMHAVVATSATLTVGGQFEPYQKRHGLEGEESRTALFPSPFDYRSQSLLVLPKDVPLPDSPGWLDAIEASVLRLVEISQGGCFVLCTSHAMVQRLGQALERRFSSEFPILAQGQRGREQLFRQFLEHRDSVLVGTDSFWEGVSVKGEGLRQVIIPRLPFRVPTHPVAQARVEAAEARGHDPFRSYALPEAVIKLRQGFGRLIRAKSDRGAVVILDRRIHERAYGRIFLHSLPPATRITGPTDRVEDRLRLFFQSESD
ncbi:MAG: helicase C-terminal domain-containing protein [Myxococcota bacterium]|nr:helicase C-terminal domain-containing protein [Myxococcota bacterium]